MTAERWPGTRLGQGSRPELDEAAVTRARGPRLARVLACLAIAAWVAPVRGATASRATQPAGPAPSLPLELAGNKRPGLDVPPKAPPRGSSAQVEGGSSADRYGGSSADTGGVAGREDRRNRGVQRTGRRSEQHAGDGDDDKRRKANEEADQDAEEE